MNRFSLRSFSFLTLCLYLIFPVLALAQSASATPPGVQWQTTSQMVMEGMPFASPAQTWKLCSPAVWTEPPGGPDDGRGCVNSSFERFENTVTWTSTCTGPPEMAGIGEIVFEDETAQAYSGRIEYATDEGLVVIKLGGKVVGTCDNPR